MKRTKDIFLEQREKEMAEGKYDYLIHQMKKEMSYQKKIKSNAKRSIR
jgi:hypothetical protein